MKLLFCIPTFNRPEKLLRLIGEIRAFSNDYIFVVDDGSPLFATYEGADEVFMCERNHGKKEFYKVIQICFDRIREYKPDFVIFLADDLRLKDVLPTTCENPTNLLTDARGIRNQWTGVTPVRRPGTSIWETGWVDGAFIAPLQFFADLDFTIHPIPESRWAKNPFLGSGVWQQVSQRAIEMKWKMHHHETGWLTHDDDGVSMMNPEERRRNPL